MVVIPRVRRKAAIRPAAMPMAVRRSPWPTTSWKYCWAGHQSHANADFGSTLPYDRRKHAVESDACEHRRDYCERSDEEQGKRVEA